MSTLLQRLIGEVRAAPALFGMIGLAVAVGTGLSASGALDLDDLGNAAAGATSELRLVVTVSDGLSTNAAPVSDPASYVELTPTGAPCGKSCYVFKPGTLVTIAVKPRSDVTFKDFGGCTPTKDPSRCTVTMTGNARMAAAFIKGTPTTMLNVMVSGSAASKGHVFRGNDYCGSARVCSFTINEPVTLRAAMTVGPSTSYFAGWSGAGTEGCGTQRLCTVQPKGVPLNITATFADSGGAVVTVITKVNASDTPHHFVYVQPEFHAIACSKRRTNEPLCALGFAPGTTVTLEVGSGGIRSAPDFLGWSGAPGCSTAPKCTFTVGTTPLSVTATFAGVSTVPATVKRTGTGSGTVTATGTAIDCGNACSASLTFGRAVTFRAQPSAGSVFKGWASAPTGSGDGTPVSCAGATECSLTPNEPFTLTAEFAGTSTLTLNVIGATAELSGPVVNVGTSNLCTRATCTYTGLGQSTRLRAAIFYQNTTLAFLGWGGAGTESCGRSQECTITIGATGATVTANYGPGTPVAVTVVGGDTSYNVYFSPGYKGFSCTTEGGPACTTAYAPGTVVTLDAGANGRGNSPDFLSWSGVSGCSTQTKCTFTVGSTPLNVTATYKNAPSSR